MIVMLDCMRLSVTGFDVAQILGETQLCLAAGLSSAGKSTFIEHILQPVMGVPDQDVHFAGKLQKAGTAAEVTKGIVHYNLLLSYKHHMGSARERVPQEPVFQTLLSQAAGLHVFLILCERAVLAARIAARDLLEPRYFGAAARYPKAQARARMQGVSQSDTAQIFAQAVLDAGAAVTILLSQPQALVQIGRDDIAQLDL